ncbi:hypothetical protein QR680_015634 [Steinernema hermaphroditum]|uniref:Mediator of RNA polymerase II transcription subunit 8 n=1 Tax=Steinernema hermaphroditum TaxID=289476 RepID=A0AA39H9J3_9BILA|nr:hypothetical protein QR680_015634 [Steinernema hermaphroditum]
MMPQQNQKDPEKVNQAVHNIDKKIEEVRGTTEYLLLLLDQNDKLQWPDMFNKFSSLASGMQQVQMLMKKSAITAGIEDQGAFLRQHLVVPQKLVPEIDPQLAAMTQGRVQVWNHDTLPDYMRTKLNPEVEQDENSIVSTKSADQIVRQIATMNKHIDVMFATMNEHGKQAEERFQSKPSCIPLETAKLVHAIMNGNSLKPAERNPGSDPVGAARGPPAQS